MLGSWMSFVSTGISLNNLLQHVIHRNTKHKNQNQFTIPRYEVTCRRMWCRSGGSGRRTWSCSRHPNADRTLGQSRPTWCPTETCIFQIIHNFDDYIVLELDFHLNDFLILHPGQKHVLLVVVRVELHTVGHFSRVEPLFHLTCKYSFKQLIPV